MFKDIFSFKGRIKRLEFLLSSIIFYCGITITDYFHSLLDATNNNESQILQLLKNIIITINNLAHLIYAIFNGGVTNEIQLLPYSNSNFIFVGLIIYLYYRLYWFIIAQGAKRCHDRGNSGWFQIIPFYTIWMLFANSSKGENKYGLNPKGIGNPQPKCVEKYDDKGNKVEENWYDVNGKLSERKIFKYDEKGNIARIDFFDSDGHISEKHKFLFGEKVEVINFNSDGKLFSKYTYKYDDNRNKIEECVYNSKLILQERFTFKYDKQGNKIEVNYFNSENILYKKSTFKYDGKKVELNDFVLDDSGLFVKSISYYKNEK